MSFTTCRGSFENFHDKAVNGSLWSLSLEVKMYLIVFFAGFLKILKNKTLFNILFFIIMIVGFFDKSFFLQFLLYPNYVHVSMMFLLGSFIYINRDSINVTSPILLFLIFIAAMHHKTPTFGLAYNILLPYLVFYLAFLPGFKFFNKIGDYSYGVYLYGWPALQMVYYLNPTAQNHIQTIEGII